MSLSSTTPHAETRQSFPDLLKSWRTRRRLSQLELALSSSVSQRHLSFLESGRAKPSREMILQLSETLDVPLRERNDLLIAAGFAPMFRARPMDDPQMSQVMTAVKMMLANHEPFPAIAVDRCWNIRMSNKPFDIMASMMGDELWTRIGGPDRNLMQLLFHPNGLKPYVANWDVIAPLMWHRARREAEAVGGEDIRQLLADLSQYQSAETLWAAEEAVLLPLLPLEVVKDGARLSLFTVISTFGTAQDATADELRIESFFPADAATDAMFRALQG
jgi:transcriptional regulator with XRE-family HTH domain